MTVSATTSEITGLQICLANTLEQIDRALDRGDRRAFRMWCKRHASLTTRIEAQLLTLATKE